MEDLSSLLPPSEYELTAGESMAGTNTISVEAQKHAKCLPGTPPVDPLPQTGAQHDTPGVGTSATHEKPTTIGKYTEVG